MALRDDGDIVINLRMDDKDFAVTVQNSGRILRSLKEDLNKTASGVDGLKGHFNSFSTSFRHTVQMFATARFAVLDFYDVMLRLPRSILETTGEIEKLTKLMEGLSKATTQTGKALEANTNRNFVIDMAKNAPSEIKALADSFVKLKTGGIDPMNGSMQALTDSVARFGGNSEALRRASVAIQQMGGKGVISMEELRQQLGEAVPDAMKIMAEGMGMSMGELTKQVSLGAVESTDALRRMFTVMEFYNRGAAEKMMNTWTGLSSRLKTEWTLLQTAIGDSGFAEAVKDQVRDLISVMSSPQGLAMAKQFGQDLASLVRTLRNVADGLRENWTLIKMIGEAILIAFGASKILAISRGLGDILKATSALAATNATKFRAEAAERATSQAQILALNAKDLQAQAAQEAAQIAKRQVYYKALLAQHTRYLTQIRALEAANDITTAKLARGGVDVGSNALILSRQKKIQALDDEAKRVEKLISKEREMQRAMQAGLIITNQSAEATNKKAAAAAKAATGVGLLSKAAIGARVALSALGGPLGLISLALTVGIPLWLEWGNSGEKAIKKIRDALDSKSADKDIVKMIDEQLASKRKELADMDNRKIDYSMFPNAALAKAQVAAERARLEKEIGELEHDRKNASSQSITNASQAEAAERKAGYQKQLNETAEFYVNQQGMIISAANEKLEGLKKGSKEEIQIERDKALALRNNVKEQGEALYKIVSEQHKKAADALKKAQDGGSPTQIASAKATLAAMSEELVQYERFKKESAHLLDPTVTKAEKEKKPDALTQALEQARGDLEAAKITMADIVDGAQTLEQLRAAAMASIMGDRASGRFNVKDDRGNSVKPAANDARLGELADIEAKKRQIDREKQAQTALTRLSALSATERRTAMERFDNSEFYERETTGVHKLQRQLSALQDTLVAGTPAFINFRNEASNIISQQAIADLVNFAADLKKATIDMQVALEDTDIGRKQKTYDLQMAALKSQLDQRRKAILDNTNLTNQEMAVQITRANEEINNAMIIMARDQAKKMRSPLQQLAVEWQDVTKQMRDASARWSNDAIDQIINFAKTGKFQWKQLADTILTDMLRIRTQQLFGPAMNGMMDKGVNFMAGLFGAKTTSPDGTVIDPTIDKTLNAQRVIDVTGGSGSVADAGKAVLGKDTVFKKADGELVTMWDHIRSGFNTVWTGLTSMLSGLGNGVMSILSNLGNGIGAIFSGGGGGGGFLSSLLGAVGGAAGMLRGGGGAKNSLTSNGASAAFGDNTGSMFRMKFADGGIMTEAGPKALRRYASGGVANFPQFAEFGEGSRPEAYVPLPDGRSIPVSITGGMGGGKMIVNVINNASGTTAETKEGKDKDGNMTLDVIIQQIEGKISKNVAGGKGSLSQTMERVYGLNRAPGAY